jgi:hypothetical protein
MSCAPLYSVYRPSLRSPIRMVDGFGSDVFPIPYHIAPMPTPRRTGLPCSKRLRIDTIRLGDRLVPPRPERLETGNEPCACLQPLAGRRRGPGT